MITFLFVLAMAPATHSDYPRLRVLRNLSPAHMRAWEGARETLGVTFLQEVT